MIELLILRAIHVLCGAVWVGAAVFSAFLLVPTLGDLGPAARPVMEGLRRRGLFVLMPTLAILTIASGARLMWITSGGMSEAYFATPWGTAYGASGGAAVLAFVLGMVLSRPNAARVARLTAELAGAEDEATRADLRARVGAARKRGATLSALLALLLVGSAVGMAVARYLV